MIEIVKPQLDLGLITASLGVVEFWRQESGLRFDHRLPVRRGHDQYRFDVGGSVIKINHVAGLDPEAGERTGFAELLIATDAVSPPRSLTDPDGNRFRFVAPGTQGVSQIGVRLRVPELERSLTHYRDVLGFELEAPGRLRCGDSRLLIEASPSAPTGITAPGPGWSYLTVQVRDCDAEVARIEALGARVVTRPVNLGEVARMAMVSDPDGNWLEISQRASLTGPLPAG